MTARCAFNQNSPELRESGDPTLIVVHGIVAHCCAGGAASRKPVYVPGES